MSEPESKAQPGRWTSLPPVAAAVLLTILVAFALTASRTEAQNRGTAGSPGEELHVEDAGSTPLASDSSTDEESTSEQEQEVPDEAAYEKQKVKADARADAKAGAKRPSAGGSSSSAFQVAQSVSGSFEGVYDDGKRSDSNGAIGPDRYIEVINSTFAIYDRSGTVPTAQSSLRDLTGQSGHIFDPEIIWDPDTNRFYYSTADTESDTDKRLDFGFSKTSTPASAGDFCKYTIPLGSIHADYPRLGDAQGLLLIGTNDYDGGYVGSNLYSVSKPASGSTCPDKSTFKVDQKQNLRDTAGVQAFDPVPANQVDGDETGWVIARPESLPASKLLLYKATENSDGTLNVSDAANLGVPRYKVPADAPQRGSDYRLNTLDAGPSQAVSAVDPSRNEAVSLWAQHTVFGASGAEVRWYEIDPAAPALFQSGTLGDSSGRYIFNAAISPDRMVDGQNRQFGDGMVLTYNSSSKTQYPDIRMVSKEGSGPISPEVLVKASSVAYGRGKGCSGRRCYWGDYPGASPDPGASSAGAHGRVWLTNMWVKAPGAWGTWNWSVTP